MTKRRMIHDCIWQSEGFAALTYRQRCLWVGIITTADDQGRARAHPGLVRAAVFPFDVIAQDEIEADLQALVDGEMLLLYQADGKAFYQVLNWWEYQRPQWVGPSDHPAPDGWLDRMRYHGKGHEVITVNWPAPDKKASDDKADKPADKPALAEEEEEEEVKVKEDTDAIFLEILSHWAMVFPEKSQPQHSNKALRKKLTTRLRESEFREHWRGAITRASKSSFCNEGSWCKVGWFLANDDNWRKALDGDYDDRRGGDGHLPPQATPVENYQDPDVFFAEGNQ